MRYYRRKVAVCEVAKFKGTQESLAKVYPWITKNGGTARSYPYGETGASWGITIDTPEGPFTAQPGDYIVFDTGEFWVMGEAQLRDQFEQCDEFGSTE